MDQNNLKKEDDGISHIGLNTVSTKNNIIDLVTADDVFKAYAALPVLSKRFVIDENGNRLHRGVIQQIQTLTISVPISIAGAAHNKAMLVVQWYGELDFMGE